MQDLTLNSQQQHAIDEMLLFLGSSQSAFALKGFAGTGKSTTIQFLLEKTGALAPNVYFTAPTHKAVKVLKKMAEQKSLHGVTFATIHSLLGLKVVNKKDRQIIKPMDRRKNDPLKEPGRHLIVVDECSMVGEELFSFIAKSVRKYNVKYIFMGDPAQLPPVGEKESPTFEKTEARAMLSQVMRQRGENPILGVCTDIREAWSRGGQRLPPIIPQMAEDGSVGVSVLHGELFTQWMPSAFSHEQFDADPDRFRVVAWRNETVNKINDWIHQLRYPNCETWLAEGEPITFVKPLLISMLEIMSDGSSDEILVHTDVEGVVSSCDPCIHPEQGIDCWLITAVTESGMEHTFYALDNDGIIQRDIALRAIANDNRIKERNGDKQNWWPYYQLKNSFAEIRPAYCMTAHKSQGSTFENVFVDVQDIWRNPNKIEALQCLYVACSRASHHLIVNASGHA